VRRLERLYGEDVVDAEYKRLSKGKEANPDPHATLIVEEFREDFFRRRPAIVPKSQVCYDFKI
jgi:hypothetical protein